jgi:hypothetical protein
MESGLYVWLAKLRAANIVVNVEMLKSKALSICAELKAKLLLLMP